MSLSMFIIPGVIMLFTHLTTDKDFNDTYRNMRNFGSLVLNL